MSKELTVMLSDNWWALVLRGLAAVLFGIIALLSPGITLTTLVLLFGIYAFIDGVFAIATVIKKRNGQRPTWAWLLEGVVGIAAGVLAFVLPGATALALLYLIAGWAVATGILEIVVAFKLRKEIKGEWLLFIAGALSVVFGLFIAMFPAASVVVVIAMVGFYAVFFGVLLTLLGLRLRFWRDHVKPQSKTAGISSHHASPST